MSASKPTKEGELKKYKNLWSGWGTRYFKLERMYLHYFESKDAPTPVNSVTRGDIDEVKLSTAFPDKQNVFEIHTKSGLVWYLQSNSNVSQSLERTTVSEPTQGPYNGPLPHIYPNLYAPSAPLYDPMVHGEKQYLVSSINKTSLSFGNSLMKNRLKTHTVYSPPPPYEEK
ncbi:uncharacterized protein LOC114961005 isoform X2 [Acropora millepora]|uniref:uncharacterized protein LOC114961005 isoform X2 n=1 Tax=Acropora millepora TaxID=45264 RepID=UPI001CF35ECB|nr:uncharacterized protein LOC114961005 isoform X2 [Acropora millepora]